MDRIPRNFYTFLLALLSWTVIAQPTNCITFDEPEVGTVFNADNTEPNTVIHQYEGVNLIMDNFTDAGGQTWFDQIRIIEETLSGSTAPSLFVNYANATFEFLSPSPVVCFTSYLSGHEINFGVNGEVGIFENWLDPSIQNEFPDYDITVTANGNDPGSTVNVCVFGVFDILTIGGIELLIDDFCSSEVGLCSFEEPNIFSFCEDPSIGPVIRIDFGSINGNDEFVDVFVDNQFQGFFSIEEFPITLQNAVAPGQQEALVTICVNDDPNCCYEEVIGIENCSNTTCAFNDPIFEAFCTVSGSTNVFIDFSSIVGNNEFVDVYVGDELFGFYPIDAFPITLENINATNPSQTVAVITVCINDNPNCCYIEDVPLPDCTNENCITFSEPEVGTVFSTETGFAPGDIVYQYPQANMIIGDFTTANGNTEFDQIQVVEGWINTLDAPSLYINYSTATFDYHIPVQELCFTGSISGHEINFGINGQVGIFESLLDPALPEQFPDFDISISSVDPNSEGIVNVCITGLIEELTVGGIEFLLDDVCAGDPICAIRDLQVAQYPCDDNTLPSRFYLNFQHFQNDLDSFQLFVNNNLYGTFAYSDLPITDIEVLASSPVIQFLVSDLNTEGCAEELQVELNLCEEVCENFFATSVELVCDNPFTSRILIGLSTPPTGQTVTLIGLSNNQVLSTATYNDWDGVLFNFPLDVDPEGYLIVDELTGCSTTIPPFDFDLGDCQECEVTITALEPTDCNPNGVFSVTVDIETSAPWQLFNVLIDGNQVFGPFGIDEFPVTIGSIVGVPGTSTSVRVSSILGTCVAEGAVTQDCFNNCDDFAATLNGVECTGTNNILISFNLSGVEIGEPIRISGPNGNIIEELVFEGNPVLVDLPPSSGIVNQLLIEALEINCETELVYEIPPGCGGCANFGMEILEVGCTLNGQYTIALELFGVEPGDLIRFTVDNNPSFAIEVDFTENPVIITVPPSNNQFFTLFAQLTNTNCLTGLDIQTPDCNPVCGEYDITGIFCEGDVTVLTFVAEGPAGDVFLVRVGNEIFEFEFGAEEYEVVFNSTNMTSYDVVFVQSNANCLTTLQIDNPCHDPCEGRFDVVEYFCNDGQVIILFTAEGEPGGVFSVQIENQVFTYEYGQNIYELIIPGNPNQEEVELLFFDEEAGCEVEIRFENPCGINPCNTFLVEAEIVECLQDSLVISVSIGGIEIGEPLRFTLSNDPNFVLETTFVGNPYQFGIPFGNSIEFDLLAQAQGIDCEQEVTLTVPSDCFPNCDERFEVIDVVCIDGGLPLIFFNAIGPTGSTFFVEVDGVSYEYTYGEAIYELLIENVGPNTGGYALLYRDALTNCVVDVFVDNPCFCFIEINSIAATECDANGNFFVELNVTGGTSWGNGVFIVSADGFTQTFTEGTSSFTIGPFSTPTVDIFINEATSGLCSEFVTVQQECEPSCEIFDLFIEGSDCDQAGNYFLDITFESNINGPFVVLNQATAESQIVTIDELPVTFGPYNIDEIQTSLIIVYEATSNSCLTEELYVQECEQSGECGFSNIFAEPYECVDGEFLVDVEFDNPGGGPLGFYIFGDGMIFGPYQYGEPFYTFGPLDGSEQTHDILILDIADPACFGTYEFDYVCSDECNITEVVAEVTECDGEVFGIALNVIGSNLGEQFIVVGNGNNYGTFSYNDLPIFLGPFEGDNETVYEFGVIDLSHPTCTNFTEVGPVNCQPCNISNLAYEVGCSDDSYQLTFEFTIENADSDLFRLLIGGEQVETFAYNASGVYTIDLPYSVNGNSIRVEDFLNELCGETIDFEIPCCSLGDILEEFAVGDCQPNGEYYFVLNEFSGGNLSDSIVINYAPAGSSIIATEVVAYGDLPAEIGPLSGDGETSYLVVLTDQENGCAETTTIEPVYCDNNDCVEFEDAGGVYGPLFGHPSGTVVAEENGVAISYEENPSTGCNTCNLFVTDGIPGVAFGSGMIAVTQNSGIGLNFSATTSLFNTVNIDFYYTGGEIGFGANGNTPVILGPPTNTTIDVAPGVELQITITSSTGTETIGMLTFSGENIESLLFFSDQTAAFDNVCRSLDDNVWPGDTNSDNVASHIDLLSIGLTYELTGPTRMGTNSEWSGFISPNWGGSFANGLNHKHADANGDGIVDAIDEDVLEQNYGLVHGPIEPFEALPHTDLDPPVFMDIDDLDELSAGSTVEIPIVAGTADQIIEDIYGLAFTLELDPEIFTMGAVEIIYPTSWFGEPGINTTHIHRVYPDGQLEVALSRTDHNNVSGFGPIMYLRIIIDDIAGVNEIPTTLLVNDIMAINHDEERLVLRPSITTALITGVNEEMDRDILASTFGIYPNPTQDIVYFKNAYNMPPNRLDLFTARGQRLTSIKNPGMEFDFSAYPAGVYMLQFHIEGKIFTKRLVKIE
ncbi:MAG: T9SS type A sorting domain-containing protein [Bacteroidota bacterium]